MPNIRFYSYGPSNSCKALSRELGGKIIKHRGSNYRPRRNHVIINWGNSSTPTFMNSYDDGSRWINTPRAVANATNKLKAFKILAQGMLDIIPCFTTNIVTAQEYIAGGDKVYCRTKLQGHGGEDIIVASTIEELVDAPLYTKRFKAGREFRVHVFDGEIIDFIKKSKRAGETPDPLIRNHTKGWVFTRESVILPKCVSEAAIKAVSLLGLDFGAVDIGYSITRDIACVYEVNTACGMEAGSTTLNAYANAIREII